MCIRRKIDIRDCRESPSSVAVFSTLTVLPVLHSLCCTLLHCTLTRNCEIWVFKLFQKLEFCRVCTPVPRSGNLIRAICLLDKALPTTRTMCSVRIISVHSSRVWVLTTAHSPEASCATYTSHVLLSHATVDSRNPCLWGYNLLDGSNKRIGKLDALSSKCIY